MGTDSLGTLAGTSWATAFPPNQTGTYTVNANGSITLHFLELLSGAATFRRRDMAFAEALEFLRSQLTIALTAVDLADGVEAFFEKPEPEWGGGYDLDRDAGAHAPHALRDAARDAQDRARAMARDG